MASSRKRGVLTGKHTEKANLPPNEARQQYANNVSQNGAALVSPNHFQFALGKNKQTG